MASRLVAELASPSKRIHVHLLYCLLGIQLAYIAVDHFAYHRNSSGGGDPLLSCLCKCPAGSATDESRVIAVRSTQPGGCLRREDYYDGDDDEKDGKNSEQKQKLDPNPWHQMKWMGQPSSCLVRGRLIEKLDEEKNFRRGYALKFVPDVEDKTHLLPWLLASKVNLNNRRRRVYIDLGANRFTTSIQWFLRMYPCDFTEIHAFESNARSWRAPKKGFDEESNVLTERGNDSVVVRDRPGTPKWMMERIHIYYKLASHKDDAKSGEVNITRFIKEELKLTREDAVIVKMDIEGSEWPLLKAWLEDAEMPEIVDELFVEVHYTDPSMSAFGWDSFSPATREDARRLLGDLRWKGFYAHAWP